MPVLKRTAVSIVVVCFVLSAAAAPPYLNIQPKPPQDLPSRNASQTDLAKFAWQEFLALNWKASVNSTHPPSPANPRGLPDLSWNQSQAAPKFPDPLVWQTYAQTTELRPNSPLTTPWLNLGLPHYSYAKPIAAGSGVFNLWNNLDEDNEIGSCDIYGQYNSQKTPRDFVLFQVKVNRDEYEYIRTAYGATQNVGPATANGPCPPNGLLCNAAANAAKNIKNPPYAYFPGATTTCKCPPNQAICLPCGLLAAPSSGVAPVEGTIEVKSAWRRLLPTENASHFYTTKAIYYDVNSSNQIAYYNDTFALVAMHIIHKTTNFPDFVFATFEQVDVEKSGSDYVLLVPNAPVVTETGPPVPIQRQAGQTNRTQMHPVPPTLDAVNTQVHAQLMGLNPSSVWQYYRLTGVYGQSTDCPVNLNGVAESTQACIAAQTQIVTQCIANNPNYYMANFMVESDPGLNNFSGTGFASKIFGNCQNTVYGNKVDGNKLYNNGGCKGCHGVTQSAFGTDFSFLLDFGNNKPAIQPSTIHYTGPANTPKAKLKHYLDVVGPLQP